MDYALTQRQGQSEQKMSCMQNELNKNVSLSAKSPWQPRKAGCQCQRTKALPATYADKLASTFHVAYAYRSHALSRWKS